jgi:hypothetical protein
VIGASCLARCGATVRGASAARDMVFVVGTVDA